MVDKNEQASIFKNKLLAFSVSLGVYDVVRFCRSLGGIVIPAHLDRDLFSVVSVLGALPEDLGFRAVELRHPEQSLKKLQERGQIPPEIEVLTSSDAHSLLEITEHPRTLAPDSVIYELLD